jgi:uncharacterized protein (TIGR02145 family)
MTKNLDVTTYRNGDTIPQVTDPTEWANLTTGAWCYYNNKDSMGNIYGKLYNWYAVNDPRGLAPEGWHVPSNSEWSTLVDYLGGSNIAGQKMKVPGNQYWIDSWYCENANNSSGFTSLPAGDRSSYDSFSNLGLDTGWWTKTESQNNPTLNARLYINMSSCQSYEVNRGKKYGFSVRCVKD